MKDKNDSHLFNKLAAPFQRALLNANIYSIQQLAAWKEVDFMKLHGVGKSGVQKLKALMSEHKVTFKND